MIVNIVIKKKEEIKNTFSQLEQVWKEQNVYADSDKNEGKNEQ